MRFFIFIIGVLLASSCKTNNLFEDKKGNKKAEPITLDSAFLYNPNYQYTIRRDDKISVSVWGQDELSVGSVYGIYNSNEVYGKWLLVDINGYIELPKIGNTHVEGLTIPQLKDSLRLSYSKWLIKPIVDIKVLNKEISILGEVRNPQVLPIDKDNNTLLEIIARSGGLEPYANIKHIKIIRQEGPNVRIANIDLSKSGGYFSKNIQLHPSDIVVVPSKKYKEFDKRISIIIPFTSTATALAILLKAF